MTENLLWLKQYFLSFSKSCLNRYNNVDFDNLQLFKAPMILFNASQLSEPPFITHNDLEDLYNDLFFSSSKNHDLFFQQLRVLFPPQIDLSLSSQKKYLFSLIHFNKHYFLIDFSEAHPKIYIIISQHSLTKDSCIYQNLSNDFFNFLLKLSSLYKNL
jgi:hypothetical protein